MCERDNLKVLEVYRLRNLDDERKTVFKVSKLGSVRSLSGCVRAVKMLLPESLCRRSVMLGRLIKYMQPMVYVSPGMGMCRYKKLVL